MPGTPLLQPVPVFQGTWEASQVPQRCQLHDPSVAPTSTRAWWANTQRLEHVRLTAEVCFGPLNVQVQGLVLLRPRYVHHRIRSWEHPPGR